MPFGILCQEPSFCFTDMTVGNTKRVSPARDFPRDLHRAQPGMRTPTAREYRLCVGNRLITVTGHFDLAMMLPLLT